MKMGEVVWCNYEFAWGGRYQSYYKEQSLNNIAIDKDHLQPLRFQGQFFDPETSLHYNRFRYYDSDVGMFVQRDPIGLLGGVNVFAYAPNPVGWVDPWGLKKYTYYQLKDESGNVIYHGITDRSIKKRISEHKRNGKSFATVSYLDNLDSRVSARNIEGSALYHDKDKKLLNSLRPVSEGYYHSYDPNKLKDGRTFLSQTEIDDMMKNSKSIDMRNNKGGIKNQKCIKT